jgi:phytoene desaturase
LTKKKHTTAIIGSGIAGIAAAIRLAQLGHKVTVFEANNYPGGKLSEITSKSYRFDAGPSLFTLPKLVDELFELCGENPKDHFEYERLEINCRYFYEDGTTFNAFANKESFIDELTSKTMEPKVRIEKTLKRSAMLYESLSDLFMYSSLNDIKNYFSKSALKAYLKIYKLGFFQTMNQSNNQLLDDPRLVQLFNRYATYNGSDPYQTPATMNIIPHLEMEMGAYFPKGGMVSITQALVQLAERQGVAFRYNAPVEKIITENKQAIGVQVSGKEIRFDRIVCNMDIVNAYKKLLPDVKAPKFLLTQPKSSSALIFYWGISQNFPHLDLHNIFFSENYQKEFEHIFKHKSIYSDPTVYVNISSKYRKEDAPENCENWFVMINVPNNQGQDWDALISEARDNIVQKLSRNLGVDISQLIVTEEILDPRTIESRTSSSLGAMYGNSSNNLFSAFLRHANKSKRIKNLYFCGGSVHPGGGIPMCLSSAKIMASQFE